MGGGARVKRFLTFSERIARQLTACAAWPETMARGWESKSVEEQMENARQKKKDAAAAHTPKPVHHSRQHENLVLARARLVKDLETTDNPRYKQFLEASLVEIDKQIAKTE